MLNLVVSPDFRLRPNRRHLLSLGMRESLMATDFQTPPAKIRGEFLGNRPLSALDLVGPDKRTLWEKYLIGEPQDCPAGTPAQWSDGDLSGFIARSRRVFSNYAASV